jgi:glycosyltransferase involved in cell wall biosynthesis
VTQARPRAARPSAPVRTLRAIMAVRAAQDVGGLEASFARLAEQLREVGVDAEALVMGADAPTSATAAFLRKHMPVRTGSSVADARRALRGADLVHVHGATLTLWPMRALVAARSRGMPAVVTLHLPSHPNRLRLRGRVRVAGNVAWRGLVLRLGAHIVAAPSAAAAETARRRLRAFHIPVRPLWNGVLDTGATPVSAAGPLRLVLLGRLSDHKRPIDFIRAVEEAAVRGADVTAVIVGDGPLRRDVEQLVQASAFQDRFTVAGASDDPSAYLRAADLLVLTSHSEGCPLSAMEAAAVGRGVVAGAGIEGLAEGWPGAFVPVADRTPGAFAGVFMQLAADRERVRLLGTKAREHFESRFAADSAAARLREVYDEAVSR